MAGQKKSIKRRSIAAHHEKKEILADIARREQAGREIRERVTADFNEAAQAFDGYDAAIIGIGERKCDPAQLVYDYEKCVQLHIDRDGWSREDAMEWLDYNVVDAFIGPGTPIFLYP